ncbi:MAG: hypothetical protein JW808_10575 [Victivallales bacterium]|nr:hypothetical protein [Victivallales bacterium]
MEAPACPKCGFILTQLMLGGGVPFHCPRCNTLQAAWIYPASVAKFDKGSKPETLVSQEHSACFYHQGKVATAHCGECGVFLCSLCDINLEGMHLCPKCFNASRGKIATLQSQGFMYDSLMLNIAVLSSLMCLISLITAPATLFGSIYFWNRMKTPYQRSKWRFVMAIAISAIQIIVSLFVIVAIFNDW